MSGGTLRLAVKPVLTWKTRILSMRDFAANQALGYGGTYVTKAPAHVAVLPVATPTAITGSFPIAGA